MPEYALSDAELFIMRQFWDQGPLKTDQLSLLVAQRQWKPTTLLTFLSRLVSKGMLAVEKQGKSNLYQPAVSQQQYTQTESRAFLDQLFDGSARDFLAAMVQGDALSQDELEEMRQWLQQQEVPQDD